MVIFKKKYHSYPFKGCVNSSPLGGLLLGSPHFSGYSPHCIEMLTTQLTVNTCFI